MKTLLLKSMLLAAVIFFGAIFYIHIFIKPTRLTGGIPKAERILGLSFMIALTVTGIYLTWMRLDRWEQFFDNSFGLMLFVKILLFALMVLTGLAAITVVHRRRKSAKKVFVVMATHDVTERLSWETQAPRTVRPEDFTPFPAKTRWQTEREKMKTVCRQCHAASWAEAHFVNFDQVVDNYNRLYFDPVKSVMDQLYAAELLDETRYFDEKLEVEYYEFWHHEGRRARMGAAMMAPDYTGWHGFYECKKRYGVFMEEARRLIRENRKAHITTDFPGAQGSTVRPEALFLEP